MQKLFFVRHGQTEWNAIRRMQGQWNSNLNDLGMRQAKVNGELLARMDIQRIYASPLDRTRQTAAIINDRLDLPIVFDDRIMEWDCGDWSGFLYADIKHRWPAEWAALEADRFNYRGPNCENYPDMFARAAPFLDEITAADTSQVAVVSHGMIGKVMVAILLGLDEAQTLDLHQTNDMVFELSRTRSGWDSAYYLRGEGPVPGLPE